MWVWRIFFYISVVGFGSSVLTFALIFFLPVSGFITFTLPFNFGLIIAVLSASLLVISLMALLSAAKWWRVLFGDTIDIPQEASVWTVITILVLFLLTFVNGILARLSEKTAVEELIPPELGNPVIEILLRPKQFVNTLGEFFQLLSEQEPNSYAFFILAAYSSALMLFYWTSLVFLLVRIREY